MPRSAVYGRWIGCWLLILTACMGYAQSAGPVRFEAFADAKQVLLGSRVEVQFTLTNAEGSGFVPPDFSGFQILTGPSRSVRTTVVNGRVSQESSYVYLLRPDRAGRLRIGPATINVGGRRLATDPLYIGVVEGAVNEAGSDFFIQAEISDTRAFVGEQLVLDYKLYTTRGIEGANPMMESDYQGFYAREVRRFDNRPLREVVQGREYTTRVLKRIALYPQQSGTLPISSYRTLLGVVEDDDSGTSFFLRRQLRQEPVETEPLTISVVPLPSPAPADFTGAIGDYVLQSSISRSNLSTDDVLRLTLRVEGSGDLKRMQPPSITLPEGFEVYDPTVQSEEYLEGADFVAGVKEFEYLLVPQAAGSFTIRPTFTYFDVDSESYETISDTSFQVTIVQGSRAPTSSADGAVMDQEAVTGEDIRPYRKKVPLRRYADTFLGSPTFLTLAALPFLFALLFVVLRARMEANQVDPETQRRLKARQRAADQLKTAEQYLKEQAAKPFYREVAQALFGYVQDKLGVPTTDLTKQYVEHCLVENGTSEATAGQYVRILENCEVALYGGKDNIEAMRATYEQAVEAIAQAEEQIGTTTSRSNA